MSSPLDCVPPQYRDEVARNLVRLYWREMLAEVAPALFRVLPLAVVLAASLAVVLAPLGVPFDPTFCVSFLSLSWSLPFAFMGDPRA